MISKNLKSSSAGKTFQIRLIELISHYISIIFDSFLKNREFVLSFGIALMFFWPSLRHGSIDAGSLYTGDVLGYYVPALIKTHSLIAHHHFSALDYSQFNGSSDFFLNANFFPLHPVVILHSLLVPFKAVSVESMGCFLVLMLAFHIFLACYFSLKLLARYFMFEFGMAVFAALGFAFSWYMVAAMGEPPFVFCATIIPWTIYGALRYAENPSLRRLLYSALPVTISLLGGYLPMGLASLLLSAVLISTLILFIDERKNGDQEQRVSSLLLASLPFFLGLFFTAPYLYAVYKFHHLTSGSGSYGIFYSAHQLADLPQTFIRLVSSHFIVPGPLQEFSIFWGVIALSIFALFFLSPKAFNSLNDREWRIFKVAGVLYFATVLAIYGEHSVVSSFVYYFVPQIGGMHIYQRFLQPAQLLFMIMLALMLKALIESRPQKSIQIALVILAFVSFACGILMTYRSEYALRFGINNYLLFELLLGCLFLGLLLIPGKVYAYYGAAILFCLPSFNIMYTLSLNGNTFVAAEQRQPMALNGMMQTQLNQYFKSHSDRPIIKYVDITPMWNKDGVETFPKDFPYLVLKNVNLSSYGGFTFYHSALANYQARMPVGGNQVTLSPDMNWLENTGVDFIIATKDDLLSNELIQELAKHSKPEDIYNLPHEAVIIPLQLKNNINAPILYDNGYFRIYSANPSAKVSANLALHKTARQSGPETGAPAQLAVDGNRDGNFTHGTVSHTANDPNAWLDIDIGKNERIDNIKIWNRTDCCTERLNHYWVFISNTPFQDSDTVNSLRGRADTWGTMGYPAKLVSLVNTNGVEGRYLRIQLSGTQAREDSYLNLAEVEVFKNLNPSVENPKDSAFKSKEFYSNNANYMRIKFEADSPTTVNYLFWNNPRIKYYLNGKKVAVQNNDGLISINVPAGTNTVEVVYVHWPLILFWIFYAIFGLLLLAAVIPQRLIGVIQSTYRRVRGVHGS